MKDRETQSKKGVLTRPIYASPVIHPSADPLYLFS